MSGPLAVATVTSALQHLLMAAVKPVVGASVSTLPLDKAREGVVGKGTQLNVFLYHTTFDAAWRNQPMPDVRAGETGFPPLPLVLHYVLTAYGQDEDEIKAHRVLGLGMSALHDHPVLGPDEFTGLVAGSDLDQQVERVRITPTAVNLDDLTKLWTAFQTGCRASAYYEVSVVLISSTRGVRTPLPVLSRGEGDRGAVAQADTRPPFPTLLSAGLPNGEPAALAGEELVLSGHHLAGATEVSFAHPRAATVSAPPTTVADDQINVTVPATPAGVCAVTAVFGATGSTSNSLPVAVGPRIIGGLPANVARDAAGAVTVDLVCDPAMLPGQPVYLLLGDRQVPPAQLAPLRFVVADAAVGEFLARVRVDGVDSRLVDRSVIPPVFDQSQKVTVT
jgi:hypothetical protein